MSLKTFHVVNLRHAFGGWGRQIKAGRAARARASAMTGADDVLARALRGRYDSDGPAISSSDADSPREGLSSKVRTESLTYFFCRNISYALVPDLYLHDVSRPIGHTHFDVDQRWRTFERLFLGTRNDGLRGEKFGNDCNGCIPG